MSEGTGMHMNDREQATGTVRALSDLVLHLTNDLEAETRRVSELTDALSFYAQRDHWLTGDVLHDGGELARSVGTTWDDESEKS